MANYCRIPTARQPANDRDDDCDFIIRTWTDGEGRSLDCVVRSLAYAYEMGSIFKVAAMYSSLPCLSLSRLCGLELGIHLTANGPHDADADRGPDANLSAVL